MNYDSVTVAAPDRGSPAGSAGGRDDGSPPPEDLPACMSCRKRKSKCSRDIPSCSQCIKIGCECQYAVRQKPGMKPGAVDSLSRRIEVLERMLLGQAGNREGPPPSHGFDARQLPESITGRFQDAARQNGHAGYHIVQDSPSQSSSADASSRMDGPRKRRRVEELNEAYSLDHSSRSATLPPLPFLEAVVEAHFVTVHHWIPILHETRFRAKLKDANELDRIAVLLHALLSTAIKYVNASDFGMTLEDAKRQIRVSRRIVMMSAMEALSIENTQALIFLAFDYMGSGHLTKAWPIIGSLTRTVDYLQLTVEPDDESHRQPLLRSIDLLGKPNDWTDSEERRRVFWSVFILDRICSIMSGWHTSLTSDDVRRRLPCNGGLWARSEPASTPLFGIWDKSNAKIGNSISNVPAIYPSPRPNNHTSPSAAGDVDTSKLGAYAYCIEATENLSQVTSFFLQQDVDFGDREEVKNWLTRFKELDLRLVHWKMFLPQQWQDSNVSRDAHIIKMDPNLTLAHISHNTSMILLHQHIAYPPASWQDAVKLPSSCSAETCQFAAVETASIVQKYLRYMGGIVNSQFAFCAFVAAKILLVHWRSSQSNALVPEFFNLLQSLQDISVLWRGYCKADETPDDGNASSLPESQYVDETDLATKYAAQLRQWHSRCVSDASFDPTSLVEILCDSSLEGLVEKPVPTRAAPYQDQTDHNEDTQMQRSYSSLYGTNRQNHSTPPNAETNWNRQYVPSEIMPLPRPIAKPRLSTAYERHGTRVSPEDVRARPQRAYGQSPVAASSNNNNNNLIGGNTPPAGMAGGLHLDGGHHNDRTNLAQDDELTAMSHMLLGNQFLEMDRVITLDGTEFFSYDSGAVRGLS